MTTRTHVRLRLATLFMALTPLAGCEFLQVLGSAEDVVCDPSVPNTCPEGFACVSGKCKAGGAVPDAATTDGAAPDGAASDHWRSDLAAHDAAVADTASTDLTNGDRPTADAAAPDVAPTDAVGHDTTLADVNAADSAIVDAAIVDAPTTDTATSDAPLADTLRFDVALVDVSVADTMAPDTTTGDAVRTDARWPDTQPFDHGPTLDSAHQWPDTNFPGPDMGYAFYDSGSPLYDSGYPNSDSGNPPYDSAFPSYDSSYPPYDSGYPNYDSGYPMYDSGYPPYDSGYPMYDSGYPPSDSGYPNYDSGYPMADAHYPESGGYPDMIYVSDARPVFMDARSFEGPVMIVESGSIGSDGGSTLCGNGYVDTMYGEECDPTAYDAGFNGQNCTYSTCQAKAVQVAVGEDFACLLTSAGQVKCWGNNERGQLGSGSMEFMSPTPELVNLSGNRMVALAAGGRHACAIADFGAVYCWGDNEFGQCGAPGADGGTAFFSSGQLVANAYGSNTIAAGGHHTCAWSPLTDAGTPNNNVRCWGANSAGQLGRAGTQPSSTPVGTMGGTAFSGPIATGMEHTCAVNSDGGVSCWGNNSLLQAGIDGGQLVISMPAQVSNMPAVGVTTIAASANLSIAITNLGLMYTWGDHGALLGSPGQPGLASLPTQVPLFVPDAGSLSPVQAAAGAGHFCVVTSANQVACWGANGLGQLGRDTITIDGSPTLVSYFQSNYALQVAAGGNTTCAVTYNGGAYCWGSNDMGACGTGDGVTQFFSTPAAVAGYAY